MTSERRAEWISNGKAASKRSELFELPQRAVDYLEIFARQKRRLIAFALYKFFPYGGLQRDFLRIAEACLARGYRVRVYTLSWEGPLPEGFDLIRVPVDAVTNPSRYELFAKWVHADLAWRPAACLVGFNKMPGLDVYFAADSCYEAKARQLRTPLYRQTRRYRHFSRFEHAVFDPEVDTDVLLITAQQREQFHEYYGTPDTRMHLLPPGVSPDRRRGADAAQLRCEFRREFEIADDETLLLLIGSGFVTKGLDRALAAVAALPDRLRASVRLFVIGQDNPRSFQNLAAGLGVADRLRIFEGRDDIPRFLQGADLMLHPAYMESGGIVLIEAIIAGLPVIATDVCGYAPLVEQADAGVLVESPFSQENLNSILARAIEDRTTRARWSANGVRFGQTADLYGQTDQAVAVIERRMGAGTAAVCDAH
ncbi:MAG: glycosyltransferase family 4 protein [Pseudomonadales bacterium]|nr:glycosyltransferase family 4 protein [Pseudomonadales bacterium]